MITLDEIAKYVHEKGPKQIPNPDYDFLAGHIEKLFNKKSFFLEKDVESIVDRIIEILPTEGKIDLSIPTCTTIMYNPNTNQLEKAHYDISKGQPLPNSNENITNIAPSSPLEMKEFSGHQPQSHLYGWTITQQQKQAAGFLETLLELIKKTPILEISQNDGDSFNRYFSYRTYNHLKTNLTSTANTL